jgi:hypothetical protein
MIELAPTRLHWVKDDGNDDPSDLCAHSPVSLVIDGVPVITPEAGDFTVSAAAIYLLRTLERDHTSDTPVGDQLFPCCGHAMYDTGSDDVLIVGCPKGLNLFIKHEAGEICLTTVDGTIFRLPMKVWQTAVLDFSSRVKGFYDQSLAKLPGPEDAAGYQKMRLEWERRVQSSLGRVK